MEVDWRQLPPELLESISKKLTFYTDYLNFRFVCLTWRSSTSKTPTHLPPQLPWLLLPQSQSNQSHSNQSHRTFYDLSVNKFHSLYLPEASRFKRHVGSSHGWLIILDDSPMVLVVNPLTRAKVLLPPLASFPYVVGFNYSNVGREYALENSYGEKYTRSLRQMRDWFLKKIVLSCSPFSVKDYAAVGILSSSGELAYCKNGDNSWKIVEKVYSYCEDVIFFKGLVYAVNKSGQIVVCDIGGEKVNVSFIETPRLMSDGVGGGDMQYLVGCGDELLLVTRFLDIVFDPDVLPHLIYRTVRFELYKLDMSGPWWVRMRSLGDRVLFIGENSSLSLKASDFSGCTSNCIYFTDDYSETNYDGHFGDHDCGIFNLGTGNVEPLPCYPQSCHFRFRWPPPLWVSPNPC